MKNYLVINLRKLFKKLKQKLKFDIKEINYINGPEVLPPPLTKEEEEAVMIQLENGDESVREKLIVHNLRLVVYIAKKFENSNVGVEDLISIGTIGLIKAVRTFCPQKKIKLATYVSAAALNMLFVFVTSSLLTKFNFNNSSLALFDASNSTGSVTS